MIEEIWKPIVGYEGLYEVSNLGNVRSLDRYFITNGGYRTFRKGKMLKLTPNPYGYIIVQLWNKQKCYQQGVHRLVAEAFIPNPNNLPVVNHKDEDKTNNCVENLEWCTVKYNTNYGTGIRRRSEKQKGISRPNTYKPVHIFKNGELIKTCESVNATAIFLGSKPNSVSQHLHNPNRHKSVKGFVLKFAS
jgi:hypothetical protein